MPSHLPSPRIPPSMDAPPVRWGVLGTGWADTVAALEVMDRVRAAAGIDFAEARAARTAG